MRVSWLVVCALVGGAVGPGCGPGARGRGGGGGDDPLRPQPGKPPEGAARVGTAHPTTVEDTAPDGSWVVLCQARRDTDGDGRIEINLGYHGDTYGDALRPYLIVGSGEGEAMDAWVGSDPTGRWVAMIQGGKLVLVDTRSGARTDLSARGASAKDDANPFGPHRAASFDRTGERMVYIKDAGGGRETVVVRSLATGDEVEIDPGPGLLWRADLAGDGRWVRLYMVARDTDGDGKLTLPVVMTSLSDRACRGPIMSYSTQGMQGDAPEERLVPAAGGAPVAGDDVVTPLGAGLVRRVNGALVLEDAGGQKLELAPAACAARVFWVDHARELVLAACSSGGPQVAVQALGRAGARDTAWRTAPPGEDEILSWPGSGWALVRSDPGALVALDGPHVVATADEDPLALHERWAITRRGNEVRAWDATTGQVTVLAPGGEVEAVSGPVLAVGGVVVDASTGKTLGRYDGTAVAVARDGRVLVWAGEEPKGERPGIPSGPLAWVAPR
jgi:hypothetical protein